jgi:hypothetical protein
MAKGADCLQVAHDCMLLVPNLLLLRPEDRCSTHLRQRSVAFYKTTRHDIAEGNTSIVTVMNNSTPEYRELSTEEVRFILHNTASVTDLRV